MFPKFWFYVSRNGENVAQISIPCFTKLKLWDRGIKGGGPAGKMPDASKKCTVVTKNNSNEIRFLNKNYIWNIKIK